MILCVGAAACSVSTARVTVECAPGGACGPAAQPGAAALIAAITTAAGLPDLRAADSAMSAGREFRGWGLDYEWDSGRGSLLRIRDDRRGRVLWESWRWRTAGRPIYADWPGAPCLVRRTARGIEACQVERVGLPYAANRLRALGDPWTLPGSAARPDSTYVCGDACMLPMTMIGEARDGARYRTYGYVWWLGREDAVPPISLVGL